MRDAQTILGLIRERGKKGAPLERVYRLLYNPDLYLMAYGKIYRNTGAMTPGVTDETVDGMSQNKIQTIIKALRDGTYGWSPTRRTHIPKKNGQKRPLGLPTWSDKLLQEVLRLLLEAYYEPQFSTHSHGFRPDRGCQTALREIHYNWTGTIWFIEGDISKCFERLDHDILLARLQENIHDGHFIDLIKGLLKAGYSEDWKWHETYSGSPQGGIVSPILSNLYLDKLDTFVEETLIPTYTKGEKRGRNREYATLILHAFRQRKKGNVAEAERLLKQAQHLPSIDTQDPEYRRLRYVRYADDFLLGFAGPRSEAEEIKRQIARFLQEQLKLELSSMKTLITHARTEKARFLNYEVHTLHEDAQRDHTGKRSINGGIGLRVPRDVIEEKCQSYKRDHRKATHRAELMNDSDFTIIETFQAEYRGLVEYYRLAYNLHALDEVKREMEQALTKTLAVKFQISVPKVYDKYETTLQVDGKQYKVLQIIKEREGNNPLVAKWGGIPLKWDMQANLDDKRKRVWANRTELEKRLLADTCEHCGVTGETEEIQVHHIRALKDLQTYTGREKPVWVKFMAARKRKTMVLCVTCHQDVTFGRPMRRKPRSKPDKTMLESAVP
jgi:group II intron reverse transcriptase/maturase